MRSNDKFYLFYLYLSIMMMIMACESVTQVQSVSSRDARMGAASILVSDPGQTTDLQVDYTTVTTSMEDSAVLVIKTDSGVTDSRVTDSEVTDSGVTDNGVTDSGVTDSGVTDSGQEQLHDAMLFDSDISSVDLDSTLAVVDQMIIEDMMTIVDQSTLTEDCDPLVGCEQDLAICMGDLRSQCIGGIDDNCQLECTIDTSSFSCQDFTQCSSRAIVVCQDSVRWITLICEKNQRCINDQQCEVLPEIYGQVCNGDNRRLCEEAGLSCGGWAITTKCLHPEIQNSNGRINDECYTAQDCWSGYLCSRQGYCIRGNDGDGCLEDEDCIHRCNHERVCDSR